MARKRKRKTKTLIVAIVEGTTVDELGDLLRTHDLKWEGVVRPFGDDECVTLMEGSPNADSTGGCGITVL